MAFPPATGINSNEPTALGSSDLADTSFYGDHIDHFSVQRRKMMGSTFTHLNPRFSWLDSFVGPVGHQSESHLKLSLSHLYFHSSNPDHPSPSDRSSVPGHHVTEGKAETKNLQPVQGTAQSGVNQAEAGLQRMPG